MRYFKDSNTGQRHPRQFDREKRFTGRTAWDRSVLGWIRNSNRSRKCQQSQSNSGGEKTAEKETSVDFSKFSHGKIE